MKEKQLSQKTILISVGIIAVAIIVSGFIISGSRQPTNTPSNYQPPTQQPQVQPYCGDSICQSTESCSSCPNDCGVCPKPVTSNYEAINKIASDSRVTEAWKNVAKNRNCGANYLDVTNAVIFISRTTISQNLIECSTSGQFSKVKSDVDRMGSTEEKQMFSYMSTCDKKLIEIFNKALRGYSTAWQAPLADKCFDCDEIYAIYLGCLDSDWTEGTWVPTEFYLTGFAVVDAKTGNVYW